MVKLFGAFNSRFFACLTPSEVRLYRGIAAGGVDHANEAQLVVSRAMDESLGLDLIRVGNQGDLFFLGKKGLFRLKNDRTARLEVVNDALCALARGEEPGRLGNVMVDADGREICYEVITPEGGLKDRFRKMLGGKFSSESMFAHQVICVNLGGQRPLNFPATLIDTRRDYSFRWSVSPSGRFLVQARPEKKSYHLDVIDVSSESIIADFQMALANIHDLWVNDAGVMMVDVRQVGEEKLIIALPDGVTRHPFCPPPGYRVVHLGPLHVAIILDAQRRLQIYSYKGVLVADVDFQPLRQLGLEFHFNFNDRGQIDVLGWQGGALHIQHADLKSIVVDAKRWDMSARQQQADTEQQLVHEATTQHIQERKRLDDVQLSRQLLDAVQSELPMVSNRIPPPTPLPPPRSQFEVPPAGDASRGVIEPPPWMSGLSNPPAPLPPPAAPAASTPVPPWMAGLSNPVSPLPPPPPASPITPLPPPAPDRHSSPPLPSRPISVPPPRDNAPLPPPDTETDRTPTLDRPTSPVARPPRLPVPEQPAAFESGTDVDGELERLRMTYIAGEITRELYYSRRSELENLRRSLSGPLGPAGPGVGPRRLDLDLGGPPVTGQPPVLRRKPTEPGLELPLPGEHEG